MHISFQLSRPVTLVSMVYEHNFITVSWAFFLYNYIIYNNNKPINQSFILCLFTSRYYLLDNNTNNKILYYTNLPTGLWTINLTIIMIDNISIIQNLYNKSTLQSHDQYFDCLPAGVLLSSGVKLHGKFPQLTEGLPCSCEYLTNL